MTVLSMADLDLTNQRVLIREDLNVPVKNGQDHLAYSSMTLNFKLYFYLVSLSWKRFCRRSRQHRFYGCISSRSYVKYWTLSLINQPP